MREGIGVQGRLTITRVASAAACRLRRPLTSSQMAWLLDRGLADRRQRIENLIVDLGLSVISRLIGFALNNPVVSNGVDSYPLTSLDDLQITTMQLGDLATPTAPAAGDNSLEDSPAAYSPSPLVTTYSDAYTVMISGLVPMGDANGTTFTEEALLTSVGALLARTTFLPEPKVPTHAIQFDHEFTVQGG